MLICRVTGVITLLTALGGCHPAVSPSRDEPALNATDVNLAIGDEKTLYEIVAAHKGKVVLVDYWATWCGPCVEFFPHTVELSRKYEGQGLATIAVSFDEPDNEPAVRRFLAKQGAAFENLLSRYGVGTEASEKFGIDQVPHFRLFDRQGKLRYKWDSKPNDLEEKVVVLLAEKAS